MDWFLYDRDPRHERLNVAQGKPILIPKRILLTPNI